MCCAGKLNEVNPLESLSCCLQNVYHTKKEICCDNKVHQRSERKDERCCKGVPFDRRFFICCGEELLKLPKNSSRHILCCGKKYFDRRVSKCDAKNMVMSLKCDVERIFSNKGITV